MRISVLTGPYFTDKDPELYGVRIPLRFWKVIAFIHYDTGKLRATGYEMGQESTLLPEEEFVFGRFASSYVDGVIQTRISTIQARTQINFGQLVAMDTLAGDDEALRHVAALDIESHLYPLRAVVPGRGDRINSGASPSS